MHSANWQSEAHNLVHRTNEQFKGQKQTTNYKFLAACYNDHGSQPQAQTLVLMCLLASKIVAPNFRNVLVKSTNGLAGFKASNI